MPGSFPIGSEDVNQMTPNFAVSLLGSSSTASVATNTPGSPPLTGAFSLSYTGDSTTFTASEIDVDSSASELAAKLNALSNLGTVSVVRQVVPNGYKWLVTFDGCKVVNGKDICNEGNVELLVKSTDTSSCTVATKEVVAGVGPDLCPKSISGLCVQYVTDLSGGAPYSYTIGDLKPGHSYYLQVLAHNKNGYGYPAITAPASVIPTFMSAGPPPPVRLVRSTATSITVEWDFPRENGGATVRGFELWMDDWSGGNPRIAFDGTDEPQTTSFTVSESTSLPVASGKSYRFSVRDQLLHIHQVGRCLLQ